MADASPANSRRQFAMHAFRIGLAVSLLAFCFIAIDVRAAFQKVGAIDIRLFALAFAAAFLGGIVFPALIAHRALVSDNINLSRIALIAINLSVRFYVIILPRMFAIAIRWRRYGGGKFGATGLALMTYERVVQFSTMFVLSAVAFAFAPLADPTWRIAVFGALGAASFVSVLPLIIFHIAAADPFFDACRRWSASHLPRFIHRKIDGLWRAVSAFRRLSAKDVAYIFANSTAGFVCFVMSAYIIAHALGLDISLLALVWIRSFVFVITLAPIAVAGIGLREVSFVGLLSLYGVAQVEALAFSLANFSVQLALAAFGLAIELTRLFKPAKSTLPPIDQGA